MAYTVKEIFKTLQGEGRHSGRPAVFCRFAGCNLWSGREIDREKAICSFCDTEFVGTDGTGGGRFADADLLAAAIEAAWGGGAASRFVVLTGGEPLLQVDQPLLAALKARGFEIAVETNGSLQAPPGIDWICVSPKAGAPLAQTSGHELKLVYPQACLQPEQVEGLAFEHFWLQPMGWPGAGRQYRSRHRALPGQPALAAGPSDSQDDRDPLRCTNCANNSGSTPRIRWTA